MQESLVLRSLKKGRSVDNFFHNILHEQIAIKADKMYELSKVIDARGESTNVKLFPFIQLFANHIQELGLAEDKYVNSCPHNHDKAAEYLDLCNIRISICISVLVNFFYPIIEQLEKIVDDGISLEKDLK
jgi:hypothetical protein